MAANPNRSLEILPTKLLTLVIGLLEATDPVSLADIDGKPYFITQLLLRFLSSIFHSLVCRLPFWLDSTTDIGRLVPKPDSHECNLCAYHRHHAEAQIHYKLGAFLGSLFSDPQIGSLPLNRTSWLIYSHHF